MLSRGILNGDTNEAMRNGERGSIVMRSCMVEPSEQGSRPFVDERVRAARCRPPAVTIIDKSLNRRVREN